MTIAKDASERSRRLIQRAAALAERGRAEECVAALREAVRLAPAMKEAADLLAGLERRGFGKAVRRAPGVAPSSPALGRLEPCLQLPLRWAEACEAEGDWDAARAAYEEVCAQGAALGRPTFECFCALARLGRCDEAIAQGKALARTPLTPWEAHCLAFPWRPQHGGRPGAREAKMAAALRALCQQRPRDPWPRLYLLQLLETSGGRSSAARRRAVSGLIPSSWRWMRAILARQALRERGLEEAAREYAMAQGATRPADWRAEGFQAETLVCLGRAREGLRVIDRAVSHAGKAERGEALAWKGELLLWLGRYGEALASLEPAARLGARFAWCWRGAAKLKLGRLEEGLADIETALREHPRDREALSWKVEGLRLLGRHREAAAVEPGRAAAEAGGPVDRQAGLRDWVWLVANRALSRAATGDLDGARADLHSIDGPAARWLSRRGGGGSLESRLAAVQKLLDAAKGYRRPEEYGFRLVNSGV